MCSEPTLSVRCAEPRAASLCAQTAPSPNALRLPRPVPQNICAVKGHQILGNETCGQILYPCIPHTVLSQQGHETWNFTGPTFFNPPSPKLCVFPLDINHSDIFSLGIKLNPTSNKLSLCSLLFLHFSSHHHKTLKSLVQYLHVYFYI